MRSKIIAIVLVLSILILSEIEVFAATKTWTTRSDFEGSSVSTGKWTHSDTSTSNVGGSITLASATGGWSDISSRFSGIDGNVVDLVKQAEDSSNQKFWLLATNTGFGNEKYQVWKTTNGGSSWTRTATVQGYVAHGIWAIDNNTIIIGIDPTGGDELIQRSTDGGINFETVNHGGGAEKDVIGVGATIFASNSLSVEKSTDSGATWISKTTNGAGNSIATADTNTVRIAGGNKIQVSTNGGSSWTTELDLISTDFFDVETPDGTNWFASANSQDGAVIYKKSGSGDWDTAWSTLGQDPYIKISMISSTSGRMAGQSGAARKTTDGFATTSSETTGTSENITALYCATMDLCFAGTDSSSVFQYSATYKTSGNSTLQFQPQAGTTQDWQSATITTTLNGQTVSTQYSHNNASWKNSISDVPNGETLYVRFSLSTNDSKKTPRVDSVSIEYNNALSSGGSGGSSGTGGTGGTGGSGGTTSGGTTGLTGTTTSTGSKTNQTGTGSTTGQATTTTGQQKPGQGTTTQPLGAIQPEPLLAVTETLFELESKLQQDEPLTLLEQVTYITAKAALPVIAVTTTAVVVPAAISVVAAQAAAAASGLPLQPGLAKLLQLFSFSSFLRRRKPPWGEVVDHITGAVIQGALVELVAEQFNKVVDRTTTDSLGRFVMLVSKPGDYRFRITARGFQPYLSPHAFRISDIRHIPKSLTISLNPLQPSVSQARLKLAMILQEVARGFSYARLPVILIGLFATSLTLIYEAQAGQVIVFTLLVALLYLGLLALDAIHFFYKKSYGRVINNETAKPLEMTIVRAFKLDKGHKILIATQVSDQMGRFSFVVPPGTYQIDAIKLGYHNYQSPPQNLSGSHTLVNARIALAPISHG